MPLSARDRSAIRLGIAAARRAGLTPEAVRLAVACGWQESNLGLRGQFVLKDGTPTYNWGATTARDKSIPSTSGTDRDYYGNPITQRWAMWQSMDQGLAYWLSFPQIKRARAKGFLDRGDENAMAREMFLGGYYTGVAGTPEQRIAAYASWLRRGRLLVLEAERGEIVQQAFGVACIVGGAWLGKWAWDQYKRAG